MYTPVTGYTYRTGPLTSAANMDAPISNTTPHTHVAHAKKLTGAIDGYTFGRRING